MSVTNSTQIAMAAAGVLFGLAAPLYAQSQSVEKNMVAVPRGEFTMGSSEHSDEAKHQVVVMIKMVMNVVMRSIFIHTQ